MISSFVAGLNPTLSTTDKPVTLHFLFPKNLAFPVADVLKSVFYQFLNFIKRFLYFTDEFVVLLPELYQLCIQQGVLDVSVSRQLHNIQNIFCARCFCGLKQE